MAWRTNQTKCTRKCSPRTNWNEVLHFGKKYGKPGAKRPDFGLIAPVFPGLFPVFWENLGGARPQRLFRWWISLAHSKDLDEHFHNRHGLTAISNGFQRISVLENRQNPGPFAPGIPYFLPECDGARSRKPKPALCGIQL
jgi:hypothetical protein